MSYIVILMSFQTIYSINYDLKRYFHAKTRIYLSYTLLVVAAMLPIYPG
jgi:hypothetical protein